MGSVAQANKQQRSTVVDRARRGRQWGRYYGVWRIKVGFVAPGGPFPTPKIYTLAVKRTPRMVAADRGFVVSCYRGCGRCGSRALSPSLRPFHVESGSRGRPIPVAVGPTKVRSRAGHMAKHLQCCQPARMPTCSLVPQGLRHLERPHDECDGVSLVHREILRPTYTDHQSTDTQVRHRLKE